MCSMLAVYLKSSLCNMEKVDVKLVDVSVNLISTLGLTWWKYHRPHMESKIASEISPQKLGLIKLANITFNFSIPLNV